MSDVNPGKLLQWVAATVMLVAGLAAFVVPLQHAGPYGIPGRGLVGGLSCLAIAGLIFMSGNSTTLRRVAFVAAPFALFLALYGALAEVEEVVVLYAGDSDLRLWIVDHDESEWVSMNRSKAASHALDGNEFQLLREGESRCVIPRIVDDPAANRRTFDLRQEKYAIQRLGGAIGMFGDGPGPETITLRLDACE